MSARSRVDVAAREMVRQRVDRGDLHVVAAADGEDETVAVEPVAGVGADDDVRRGIVRVGVHRVRSVQVARGREPDVVGCGMMRSDSLCGSDRPSWRASRLFLTELQQERSSDIICLSSLRSRCSVA